MSDLLFKDFFAHCYCYNCNFGENCHKKCKLYLYFNIDSITDEILNGFYKILPKDRQDRINRYKDITDKKLSCISYILLLYALNECYGIQNPSVNLGMHGKPFLVDYPYIYFNISHCKYGCACVVADVPVGVDIQDIRSISYDVVKRVCTKWELEQLSISDDENRLFTKIWAMKESYFKMTGEGIRNRLNQINTLNLHDHFNVYEYQDYIVSVCVE